MQIQENISLSELTTMRVGGAARWVLTCESRDDIVAAVDFARQQNLPWFVLGGGSNVIAKGNFDGVIILNRIKEFKKVGEDENSETYSLGAGENWDETVAKLCNKNLSGVEALSLIPGVAGSTPVQNVGAYGQEISQTLTELTVFDTRDNQFKTLSNSDCKFGYRSSIFKKQDDRHYIICDITLRLSRRFMARPFYSALEEYLTKCHSGLDNSRRRVKDESHSYFRDAAELSFEDPESSEKEVAKSDANNWILKVSSERFTRDKRENDSGNEEDSSTDARNDNRNFSPSEIRAAVIAIRDSKLPRVDEIPSAGSFFKNSILSKNFATEFLEKFPDAPHWPMSENEVKFSAGWLIDQAGLKGYENYGFQLYPKNALVITNVAHGSAENLAKFKQEIIAKVHAKFGVKLEQEPESL